MRKISFILRLILLIFANLNCSSNYTYDKTDQNEMMNYINNQSCKYLPDSICPDQNVMFGIDEYRFSYIQHIADESSIYEQRGDLSVTAFRFTWTRTFHNPIIIRLTINNDFSGMLFIKRCNGLSGYDIGDLVEDRSIQLSKKDVREFLNLINENHFWDLPSCDEQVGLDGADWIIEGLQNGKYHIAKTWSPDSGSIRELGMFLINHSGLKIKQNQIY